MPSIMIVGAGVAGLALAAALDRRGIASVVFEQSPVPPEGGAGVQVAPNASRLLHRLGLEDRLRAVAARPVAREFRRWDDDRLIARTALGPECERLYGAPYYTLHRADLRDALASVVPGEAVRLGRRIRAVREGAGGALLEFADGSCRQAALAVGADGIRSVARGVLARDAPVFSGLRAYRGLALADTLPGLAREPAVRMWAGPGRHIVCYPVCAGRLLSFTATVPGEAAGQESWAAEGTPDDLRRAFRGWNETVRTLIGQAQAIRCWDLYDRPPLPCLSTGRVALVGDAAHPMLPFAAQGANQAVEDAFALAACLPARREAALGAAARHYSACRAQRTARVQRHARANLCGLHLPDGDAQRHRDKALRAGPGLREAAWLYGYDAEGECRR